MRKPAATSPELGIRPHRYQIRRSLGRGASSRAYLAFDRWEHCLRTIKCVPTSDHSNSEALRREFLLRCRLGHTRIPRALDYGIDDSGEYAFLVTEFAPGETLRSCIDQLHPQFVAPLLAQALEILHYLHQRGVIHGDLKPENMVVAAQFGRPKLHMVDFGLALENCTRLRGGSWGYMAPRQLRDWEASPSSDLFALGKSFRPLLNRFSDEQLGHRLAQLIRDLSCDDEHLRPSGAEEAHSRLRLPQVLRGASRTGYVGNAEELELYTRALAGDYPSAKGLALVADAGLGKSRILEEFRDIAIAGGHRCLLLRAPRGLDSQRFLRQLATRLCVESPTEDVPNAVHGGRRSADLYELGEWMAKHAVPHVVLLDDVHHLDSVAINFLSNWITSGLPGAELLVVTTRRASATEILLQSPELVTREISPLQTEDIEQILSEVDARELTTRARLCRGSPQLAALLRDTQASGEPNDVTRRLLDRKWQLLTHIQQGVVADLAMLQSPVNAEFMVNMTGLSKGLVKSALDVGCSLDFVAQSWFEDTLLYYPPSDLVRSFMESLAAPAAQLARHRRALEAWRSTDEAVDGERAANCAHHLLEGDCFADGWEELWDALDALRRVGELSKAEQLLRRAIGKLSEVSDPCSDLQSDLQEALLEILLKSGKTTEADDLLCRLRSAPNTWDAPIMKTRLLRWLGTIAGAKGDLQVAIDHLREARQLASATPHLSEEFARVSELLGRLLFVRGELDEARRTWQQAITGSGHDSAEAADLYNNLGVYHTLQRNNRAARSAHGVALSIRRSLGDIDGESRSLTNLANIEYNLGRYDRALDLYHDSQRLKERLGNLRTQCSTLSNIALVYELRGDFEKAFGYLRRTARIARHLEDPALLVSVSVMLALFFARKGRFAEAWNHLRSVEQTLESADVGESQTLMARLAEVQLLLNVGEFPRARSTLSKLEVGPAPQQIDVHTIHAELLWLEGKHDQAKALTVQAHEIASESGDTLRLAKIALLMRHPAARQRMPDQTQELLESVLPFAQNRKLRPIQLELDLIAAEVQLEHGKLDPAVDTAHAVLEDASRLGLTPLVTRTLGLLGFAAGAAGRHEVAVGWWSRALQIIRDECERLPAELSTELFTEHPERSRIQTAASWLSDYLLAQGNDNTTDHPSISRAAPRAKVEDLR